MDAAGIPTSLDEIFDGMTREKLDRLEMILFRPKRDSRPIARTVHDLLGFLGAWPYRGHWPDDDALRPDVIAIATAMVASRESFFDGTPEEWLVPCFLASVFPEDAVRADA